MREKRRARDISILGSDKILIPNRMRFPGRRAESKKGESKNSINLVGRPIFDAAYITRRGYAARHTRYDGMLMLCAVFVTTASRVLLSSYFLLQLLIKKGGGRDRRCFLLSFFLCFFFQLCFVSRV